VLRETMELAIEQREQLVHRGPIGLVGQPNQCVDVGVQIASIGAVVAAGVRRWVVGFKLRAVRGGHERLDRRPLSGQTGCRVLPAASDH
jgi:hypothetical protein